MEKTAQIESLQILLVEDSKTDAYAIQRALNKCMAYPCRVLHAESMTVAEFILKERKGIDLILLDLGLPDTAGGKDTFKRIDNVKEMIPIIVLTGIDDHDLAVGIVGKGAEDYIRKSSVSADPQVLCEAVDFAVCRHRHIEKIKEQMDAELEKKDHVIEWMTGSLSERI